MLALHQPQCSAWSQNRHQVLLAELQHRLLSGRESAAHHDQEHGTRIDELYGTANITVPASCTAAFGPGYVAVNVNLAKGAGAATLAGSGFINGNGIAALITPYLGSLRRGYPALCRESKRDSSLRRDCL
jgi:hypothetical protein